jgi:uncharacterized membrane protein
MGGPGIETYQDPISADDQTRPHAPTVHDILALAQRFVRGRVNAIAIGISSAYFVTFAALSIARHLSYHSRGYDMGVFDQIFWNTIHGRPFESTLAQGIASPHSFLGDHFSPILWTLVPFYYAYPHPETLLVLQTLALTLAAWPIFLLARMKLGPGHALVWLIAYFLFVPLAHINLEDFHEIAFAPLPLAFALYFLESGKSALFVGSLLASFLVKEEVALVGLAFGLYALLGKRELWLGLGVTAMSAAAFVSIVYVLLPAFAGGAAYPYIAWRYADIGGSPSGILRTLVTNPVRVARVLAETKKVYFVIAMLGPVVGMSVLAGWATLLILPTFAYLLLSSDVAEFSFTTHYSAPLIPLILGTAVIAQARLKRPVWTYLSATVIACSLVFCFAFGNMPGSLKFDPNQFRTEARYAQFLPSLKMIPPDAVVAADNGLSSQLAERRLIYDFDFETGNHADWVVLDIAAMNHNRSGFEVQLQQVEAQGYSVVAQGDGLRLLRKT